MTYKPPTKPATIDRSPPRVAQPDGALAYDANGVDLTLIRWMLSLTPRQRLQVLEQNVRAVRALRNVANGT